MSKFFEVGMSYRANDSRYDPITVLRRTPKCIVVSNGTNTWRMRVHIDDDENEYAMDSSIPTKWRDTMTFSATKGENNK